MLDETENTVGKKKLSQHEQKCVLLSGISRNTTHKCFYSPFNDYHSFLVYIGIQNAIDQIKWYPKLNGFGLFKLIHSNFQVLFNWWKTFSLSIFLVLQFRLYRNTLLNYIMLWCRVIDSLLISVLVNIFLSFLLYQVIFRWMNHLGWVSLHTAADYPLMYFGF